MLRTTIIMAHPAISAIFIEMQPNTFNKLVLSPAEGQNATSYYTPYTFSGKERDMEMRSIREDLKKINQTEQTQYSYFGARYYDAGLSIWLSVDPMADERPSLSPYNYCQWNPVMLVDPTGMLDEELDGHHKGGSKLENFMEAKKSTGKPATQRRSNIVDDSANKFIGYAGEKNPKLPTTPPLAPARQDATTVVPTRSSSTGSGHDISLANVAGNGAEILEYANLFLDNKSIGNAGTALSIVRLGANLVDGQYAAAAVDALEIAVGPELIVAKALYGLSQSKRMQNDIAVLAREQKALSGAMLRITGGSKTWERQYNQAVQIQRTAESKLVGRKN